MTPAHSSGAAASRPMPSGIGADERLAHDDVVGVAAVGGLAVVLAAVVGRDEALLAELLLAGLALRALAAGVDHAADADPVADLHVGDGRSRPRRRCRRSRGRGPSGRWPGPTRTSPGGCRCDRCRRTSLDADVDHGRRVVRPRAFDVAALDRGQVTLERRAAYCFEVDGVCRGSQPWRCWAWFSGSSSWTPTLERPGPAWVTPACRVPGALLTIRGPAARCRGRPSSSGRRGQRDSMTWPVA